MRIEHRLAETRQVGRAPEAAVVSSATAKTPSCSTSLRATASFVAGLPPSSAQTILIMRPCTPPAAFARATRASNPLRAAMNTELSGPVSG